MNTDDRESQKRIEAEILAELDDPETIAAGPIAKFSFDPEKTAELLRCDQLKKLGAAHGHNFKRRKPTDKPRNPLGSQAEIARYRREEGREEYNGYGRKRYAAMIKITEGRDVREYRDLSGLTAEQKEADRREKNTAARRKKRAAEKAAKEASK